MTQFCGYRAMLVAVFLFLAVPGLALAGAAPAVPGASLEQSATTPAKKPVLVVVKDDEDEDEDTEPDCD